MVYCKIEKYSLGESNMKNKTISRIIALTLCLVMLLCFVACGSNGALDSYLENGKDQPSDSIIIGGGNGMSQGTQIGGSSSGNRQEPDFEPTPNPIPFPYPDYKEVEKNVIPSEDNKIPSGGVVMSTDDGSFVAYIPEGTLLNEGVTSLKLTISSIENSQAEVVLTDNEESHPFDVHIEGISKDNKVPVKVYISELLPKGLNMGNYRFYHVQNGETVEMTLVPNDSNTHNTYEYDPITGDVTLYVASFSEIAVIADKNPAWEGSYDYTWYDESAITFTIANADQLAAFSAIVGGMNGQTQDSFAGKTVVLTNDIDLGDKESENNPNLIFYPIGYYNSEGTYERTNTAITSGLRNFEGVFDGNGHTIANFYHNTWEMKGDHNWYAPEDQYYRDGMGLFGRVYCGTVKNLTVSNFSSDGEIATTGVIAAYADGATFENIAIFNCNPRVYNIGNGGIVGCVGWYAKEANLETTFKNITVDNSNKISALWGSYDVACGGIVGQYYPTSGQTSAGTPKNAGIHLENCHVSAIMDVYNDVCGNYQYYAYRYAGMIIGSIRENTVDENGKTIPDMTGISATGCTVNYGDWNDYYYCEFEKNGHPSYSGPDDYKFSRVPHSELNFTDSNGNGLVDADERASVTGCKHNHTAAENNNAIYLPFHQLFTGYGWGVNSIGLEKYSGIVTNLDITEGDQEESVVKFESKFTGDFLYRVGNGNTVSLGSLFTAKGDVTINHSGVWVTITKVDENSNVSGTFTANTSEWTKGSIQFAGTGVVKVTIQDYNFCTPTVLYLEVVDAVNAIGATSATANNVVMLNDADFGSLEVSGGYTLYGNGFTLTCKSDSAALDMGYAFVTLDNGTLDNVQIVCPNFDYAVLYKSNMEESGNRSETTDRTRYFNVKSGVKASGNSQILNSRISGARAAVNVAGGNLIIDNSRIELGAVASLLVGAANSLILRDVTLVQKPTASTYDPSKTLMGFSVLFVCDANGNAAPVTIEGTLVQNAWVDENDKQYVPSAGQSIISTVLKKTEYLHDIDGDGTKESLNLGFAYMPESSTSKVNTTTITDNRTNKDTVPYDYAEVTILSGKTYVYSYKNTNGTADSFKTEAEYVPNKQGDIITVNYSDTQDGLTTGKSFGTDGWVYELNVDLDKLSGYAVDFSKLSMTVNGVTVTDYKVNGSTKPTSPVAVTAGGVTYTLTATLDGKEYTATYKVTGTETSKESPSLVASKYEAALLVGEAGSRTSKDTWHGAAPALEEIQIKYWSVAEKQYKTIKLSDYTPTTAGKQNGTNTTWTYTPANGDFTLTLTGGQVHSSNNVYAMPVVVEGKLYFVAAKSSGLVNSGNSARTIPVSYTFKDNNNGDVLTFSHTWSIECADGNTAYDYSDFCNGTSKTFTIKFSNGNICVTADTLVSLADGTQKRVDQVTYEDQLLVWDFFKGEYTAAPSSIIFYHGDNMYRILKLNFADGTSTKVVNNHGFFDVEENKFVFIDELNVENYIGHNFVKVDGDSYTSVQLVSYEIFDEYTGSYSIQTAQHNNFMVENMFSITMPEFEGWFDYFEIGDGMKYDEEKMQADIEKYGLYTYEELSEYVTYEQFIAFSGPYLKVLVGRGVVSFDQILDLIEMYVK